MNQLILYGTLNPNTLTSINNSALSVSGGAAVDNLSISGMITTGNTSFKIYRVVSYMPTMGATIYVTCPCLAYNIMSLSGVVGDGVTSPVFPQDVRNPGWTMSLFVDQQNRINVTHVNEGNTALVGKLVNITIIAYQ